MTRAKYVSIPPDGGWGWVIVAASFYCNIVVDGIIFSFGVFTASISQEFEESVARTSLMGSLLSGFYLIAGPFVSALANKYGFRISAIAGSILAGFGFGLSYFATGLNFLFITFGVIGGIGFGLIYVPAVIAVGFYFERWRALATGIAVCGSGIGTIIMPPFLNILIESLGWRGALVVEAGIILSCIFAGLLFRPLEPTLVVEDVEVDEGEEEESQEGVKKKEAEVNDNQVPLLPRTLNGSIKRGEPELTSSRTSIQDQARMALKEKRLSTISQQSCPVDVIRNGSTGSNLDVTGEGYLAIPDLNPVAEEGGVSDGNALVASNGRLHHHNSALLLQGRGLGSRRASRVRTASECSIRSNSRKPEQRPMQREDILFTGSMQRLPQYTSQSSLAYHASVTRLPQSSAAAEAPTDEEAVDLQEDSTEEEAPARSALSTMLDMSLLTSPTFLLLCASGFLTMMGFFVPFMFLKDRAKYSMSSETAVWLISSIGITNTVGRVLCGLISSVPSISVLVVNNLALTIGGIATIFSAVSMEPPYQFFYCFVFGMAVACFASLRSILLVDLLGLDKLTNAFGLLILFQGLAATIGPPIAGAFMDFTGTYNASFYLAGGLILISGIMCYPLNIVQHWENNRKKTTK